MANESSLNSLRVLLWNPECFERRHSFECLLRKALLHRTLKFFLFEFFKTIKTIKSLSLLPDFQLENIESILVISRVICPFSKYSDTLSMSHKECFLVSQKFTLSERDQMEIEDCLIGMPKRTQKEPTKRELTNTVKIFERLFARLAGRFV